MEEEPKSLLGEIVEINPKALKILDFFLDSPNFDFSKTYISKTLKINRVTLSKIWKHLEDKKIILFTRRIGRAELYCLNLENPFVQITMKMSRIVLV